MLRKGQIINSTCLNNQITYKGLNMSRYVTEANMQLSGW